VLLSGGVGRGPVTDLLNGSTFEVSWHMGYAHPVSTICSVMHGDGGLYT